MAFLGAHTSRAKGRAWEYSNEPIGVGCSAATHSFPLPPERVNLSLITKNVVNSPQLNKKSMVYATLRHIFMSRSHLRG